jgi:hypothetical protein
MVEFVIIVTATLRRIARLGGCGALAVHCISDIGGSVNFWVALRLRRTPPDSPGDHAARAPSWTTGEPPSDRRRVGVVAAG